MKVYIQDIETKLMSHKEDVTQIFFSKYFFTLYGVTETKDYSTEKYRVTHVSST